MKSKKGKPSPLKMLFDLSAGQKKKGKKKTYIIGELNLFPLKYEEGEKPIFSQKDIDDLVKESPVLPSTEVEIRFYANSDDQKGASVSMERRAALLELLNQAMWRYKHGKGSDPIPLSVLRKEVRKIIGSLKKTGAFVWSSKSSSCEYLFHIIEKRKAVYKAEKQPVELLAHFKWLEESLTNGIEERKRQESIKREKNKNQKAQGIKPLPNISRNKGDTHFLSLIDDLCRIWVRVFERDVGVSKKNLVEIEQYNGDLAEVDKQKLSGPFPEFLSKIFQEAGINKSEKTIIKATRSWKKRYKVKDEI